MLTLCLRHTFLLCVESFSWKIQQTLNNWVFELCKSCWPQGKHLGARQLTEGLWVWGTDQVLSKCVCWYRHSHAMHLNASDALLLTYPAKDYSDMFFFSCSYSIGHRSQVKQRYESSTYMVCYLDPLFFLSKYFWNLLPSTSAPGFSVQDKVRYDQS